MIRNITTENSSKLEDVIKYFINQHNIHEGYITCEFSLHKTLIELFKKIIFKSEKLKYGFWSILTCNTCVEYHGEGMVHVSIFETLSYEKIKNVSNLIYIQEC